MAGALRYVGEWVTLDQAAQVLGVTRAELRFLCESGDLELVRLDDPPRWRVRTASAYDLLDEIGRAHV